MNLLESIETDREYDQLSFTSINSPAHSRYAILGDKPSPYLPEVWRIFDSTTGAWLYPDGHFGHQEHNAEIFKTLDEARARVAELDREDYRRTHPDADKDAKSKIIDMPKAGWLPAIIFVTCIGVAACYIAGVPIVKAVHVIVNLLTTGW